jgi:hypothetical protein
MELPGAGSIETTSGRTLSPGAACNVKVLL